MSAPAKIAIIGCGIAGMAAAFRLSPAHDVTVYEAAEGPGGHAWTLHVPHGGETIPIDVGFQLFHEGSNPNLTALFAALDVATEPVEFTLSVVSGADAWTNNGVRTPFGDATRAEMLSFVRAAPRLLALDPSTSIRQALTQSGHSPGFIHKVLAPLLSFWWVSRTAVLDMPAFAVGAGVLQGAFPFFAKATFHRVVGGAERYVRRLVQPFEDRVQRATPVLRVERSPDGVTVHDARGGARLFDQVIFALDAAATLSLLADPGDDERRILGAARFETSTLIVHRDERVMPASRALWSYGNQADAGPGASPGRLEGTMTYWAPHPARASLFVTVADPDSGPDPLIAEETVLARRTWRHLVVDGPAPSLVAIQGRRRTWFSGGHTAGYPVHEHALCSGLAVAEALGAPYPFTADEAARRAYEAVRSRVV
jgi:hypothetical protein